MKLFNKWPSSFHWLLQATCTIAHSDLFLEDEEGARKDLLTAVDASAVRANYYTDGEWNLNVDIEWTSLANDMKVLKVFSFLKAQYGAYSFQAELVACSNNETWDCFVAYYNYNPAKAIGIRRTYLSCSECAFLCKTTMIEELYTVFDHVLLLKDQENIQEVGGIIYVDEENHLIENKTSVLLKENK